MPSVNRQPDSPSARRQVAAAIRERIESGLDAPGTVLGGAPAIAKEYEVSAGTAHAALDILAHEGLIVRIPRVGNVVAGEEPVRTQEIMGPARISVRMPTIEERREMDIPPGVAFITIERLADGEVTVEQLFSNRTILEIPA